MSQPDILASRHGWRRVEWRGSTPVLRTMPIVMMRCRDRTIDHERLSAHLSLRQVFSRAVALSIAICRAIDGAMVVCNHDVCAVIRLDAIDAHRPFRAKGIRLRSPLAATP